MIALILAALVLVPGALLLCAMVLGARTDEQMAQAAEERRAVREEAEDYQDRMGRGWSA